MFLSFSLYPSSSVSFPLLILPLPPIVVAVAPAVATALRSSQMYMYMSYLMCPYTYMLYNVQIRLNLPVPGNI